MGDIKELKPPAEPTLSTKIAVKRIFGMLKGCPTGYDKGRHHVLNRAALALNGLVEEAALSEADAEKAFWKAAQGINNSDNKYPAEVIEEHWDSARAKVRRR
jgi:hypothetical protein